MEKGGGLILASIWIWQKLLDVDIDRIYIENALFSVNATKAAAYKAMLWISYFQPLSPYMWGLPYSFLFLFCSTLGAEFKLNVSPFRKVGPSSTSFLLPRVCISFIVLWSHKFYGCPVTFQPCTTWFFSELPCVETSMREYQCYYKRQRSLPKCQSEWVIAPDCLPFYKIVTRIFASFLSYFIHR